MLLGNVEIVSVQPGIFSVTADGKGVANGQFERYTNVFVGAQETFQLIGQNFVPRPVAFGPTNETLWLILYGTGFRNTIGGMSGATVNVTLGGTPSPVGFAGRHQVFVGVDQLNVGPLPRSLAGRGTVDVVVTVDGKQANTLQVAFQ